LFKVLAYERGKIVINVNFHTLVAAQEAAIAEVAKGRNVELCDMELSRLMSGEALHPLTGRMRRVHHG